MRSPVRAVSLAVSVCALFVFSPAVAHAGFVKVGAFGSEGEGEGQFGGFAPFGMTVDQASGDIYVSDILHNRVEKFDSTGRYILQFGSEGEGDGQFRYAMGVAVDNSLSLSSGDVYVRDYGGGRVEKFDSSGNFLAQVGAPGSGPGQVGGGLDGAGLAVNASGNLYVADPENHRVEKFDSGGNYLSEIANGLSSPEGLAIDPAGNLYVSDSGVNAVMKFDSSGNPLGSVASGTQPQGLATDPAGDLFVFAEASHIIEYSPSGVEVAAFGAGSISAGTGFSNGIAFGDGVEELYAPETNKAEVVIFGSRLVPPTVEPGSEAASDVTSTSTTLHATINPNSSDTAYHFEYDTSEYAPGGVAHGTSVPVPDADIGSGSTAQGVSQAVGGLAQGTLYHFRVVATSPAGVSYGEDAQFTTATPAAPSIDAESFINVTTTTGTLTAKVNPNWSDSTCHFEYGTDTGYGTSAPCTPGDLGESNADQAANAAISGLTSGVTYHYRVVATNAHGTTPGADQTLTTLSPAGAFTLPDDRAYELVSPQEKAGYDVTIAAISAQAVGSSVNGDSVAYMSYGAFPDSPSSGLVSVELASRGAQGWSNRSISPAMTCPCTQDFHNFSFSWFSPDLSKAVLSTTGSETSESPKGYTNLYLRDNVTNDYRLLSTVTPPHTPASTYEPVFAGASADLSHILFEAHDALTPDAPYPGSLYADLYEVTDAGLSFVGILPNGSAAQYGSGAGGGVKLETAETFPYEHAISSDGSRVFFTALEPKLGGAFYKKLYMREKNASTIDVSPSQRTTPDPHGPRDINFMTAASDGSEVFFTSHQALTDDANTGPRGEGNDLYVYDVEAGKLTDLTPDREPGDPEGASVLQQDLVGASADGSYIYFAATGKLVPGAVSGAPNLYVVHNNGSAWEEPKLIATLPNSEDSSNWLLPGLRTARVTPDGRFLAFTSLASLTGYDNTDAATGQPDREVYRYDAVTGRLTCVSCNPSGSRPIGNATIRSESSELRPQRYISDDGQRVFFESSDALVPGDTNGRQDVYEWEADGKGSCQKSEGCVYLISTGQSDGESYFLDASPSGDDVFFTTRQQLVAQDQDDLIDLYDARVGGGFPYTQPAVPCAGEGCRPAPSQPPLFGSPSSSTFFGQGNLAPAAPATKPPKHHKRRHKRRKTKRAGHARRTVKAAHRARAHGGSGR
jgi:NHL repeat/WD40-like Beta Propeller Repeat